MNGIKNAIRRIGRPIVTIARDFLEPTPEKVVVGWHTISNGPAKGCEILLPAPSGFVDSIVPGNYEPLCTQIMEALITRDSVCFDIGGHYGYFTLVLASLARDGRVETFEPVPSHAKRIAESAARSNLSHVTLHQKAVADVTSTMTLRYAPSGDFDSMGYLDSCGGVASEAAAEQYPNFETISVPSTTLDDLLGLNPDFIKMDAEGAEAAILRGGMKMLSNSKVRLFIEVHGIRAAFECADILRRIGYRAILLGPQEATMPMLCVSERDTSTSEAVKKILNATPNFTFEPNPTPSA